MYFTPIAKTHFNLGRVHVHVHTRRFNLQIQRIDRLTLAMQDIFVSAARRMAHHLVAHKAAIDIGVLVVRAGPCCVWNASPTDHREVAALVMHRHRIPHKVVSQHIGQTSVQRAVALLRAPLLHQLAFVPNGKAHLGARQCVAAHSLYAVRQLGVVGL